MPLGGHFYTAANINRNTRVHILERKQDSVVFTVQIENVNYKVFATKIHL